MNTNKNPEILVCQFMPGERGLVCKQPIGRHPQFGRVYLDRTNTLEVFPGKKYLCQVVHSGSGYFHVVVLKSAQDVLNEMLPALLKTSWNRGSHATDDVKAESVNVDGYGPVQASWYESTGGRVRMKFVTLKFLFLTNEIDLTVEDREAKEQISALQKKILRDVGPAVDLSAVIARRAESSRSNWR